MIKGLAITPPVLGRISIGRVVEKNGKRIPVKEDQFTVTTQIQNQEGWIVHPLDEELRQQAQGKLRSIPVSMLFNDPDLNLRAEYSLFDRQTGRPICAGNGQQCRRLTTSGMQIMDCPSPNGCDIGKGGHCKPYGRLNVGIGDEHDLGTFILRTTGFNSIRTLAARLHYFHAVSGGLLACMPLELVLRGKSTTQSHRAPIYYVDLTVRRGKTLQQAISEARELHRTRTEMGYDQQALDQTAWQGLNNASFEASDEDVQEIMEEFYPEASESVPATVPREVNSSTLVPPVSLTEKLILKAQC